jgi:hypothetical protein
VAGRVLAAPLGFLVAWCAAGCVAAPFACGACVGGTTWTFAAGAAAVRANTIANPTVASAPS